MGDKTRADAENYVITAIEANGVDVASREEFNLEAIIDELRERVGDWDFDNVDEHFFWETVKKHDNSQNTSGE